MPDPASVPLFRLEIARLRHCFSVLRLRGTEAISQPFVFELEVVNEGLDVDLASLMYKPVFLSFQGGEHGFHGQIHSAMRSHFRPGPACYRLTIGPRLACLGQRYNQRIFQHMTAPQIIARVLEEHGLRKGSYRFELKTQCREREYCAQYQESDLQLVERLCAEEGIHYHFIHSRQRHELVFGDSLRGFRPSPAAPWQQLPYRHGVTCFAVSTQGEDVPGSRSRQKAEGESCLPFVMSGYLLPLTGHPETEWNHMWLVNRVEHRCLEPAPEGEGGEGYTNRFQAVPWEVGFSVPEPQPRPQVPQLQRAWVVGLPGQEVARDSVGRLKVQFEWGLQGRGARYNDCWLPVMPGLDLVFTGGMEVLVSLLDDDMDRPVITACLHSRSCEPVFAQPASALPADSVQAQLDWQMIMGEKRRFRLDNGPMVSFEEGSELSLSIGSSQVRLDSSGLTLTSPKITFAGRMAESDH
ncbi:contractile injection system protein, VgrG/Pvc8 family [Pseudomonas capsici]|uniref:Contractile injection system protein, VgrG/Pvc8 family n=1 Tax=Pseudomonas capsici TaxID=2810614 RepID=A0ABT3C104_9PSED|nr:contractile injection system protein, VgrG/Pvc8 family [Pseudomonas capsici]MBN6716610.1 type IV secretion protein Rhs [Pseudomonas capsici]MBN6721506.1 type IV secretion protein Rhs [Pseudomonas capsici]MBN6726504.1 type IV secretion protein Rhs [Pseudomonas capsici]MCV4269785.1 contractile injection system protein, VgrG/Pvc8 family [Pseudomonas capsici]MCV4280261.1 contractile injection system protein, VgrG/Pvc8 family [Pseudomonas capsici]